MQRKLLFTTFYILIANVLSNKSIREQTEMKTCSERNKYPNEFEFAFSSWNMGNPLLSSQLSFLEALAGDYINFFILNRYGMSEPIENTTEALFNKAQTFYAYTSICEMARYSYIPYEKIVVNECVGETCGHTADGAPEEVLSSIIGEAANKEHLGGISVGNYNPENSGDVLLKFSNVILENKNKSAFFETSTDDRKKYSVDVPRFILNIEEFPGAYGAGLGDFFTNLQKHGVNYTVVEEYNAETSSVGDNLKWYRSACFSGETNTCLSNNYTKVLAKVTNITQVIYRIIYEGGDAYYEANKIAQVIRDYNIDGVVLELREISDFLTNPDTLCAASFLIQNISENVKPNIIAINADIKDMVPFVENSVWSDAKKTEVWNFMRDTVDGYNRCYTEKINPEGNEWENTVVQGDVFLGADYARPNNEDYIANNFFEVFDGFGASRDAITA